MTELPSSIQPDRKLLRTRIAIRLQFLVVAIWLALLATTLGRFHWILDLTTHFVVQYCVLSLVLATAAWVLRLRWTACFATAAFLVLSSWIVPIYTSPETRGLVHSPLQGETIRLMSCNVLTSNLDQEPFRKLIESESPNIVLMMEIDANWHERGIRPLQDRYPYQYVESREDNFGIALISDRPLSDVLVREFDQYIPSIAAKLECNGERIQLIGTHPLPPINGEMWRRRNQQFEAIANFVVEESSPTIVFGDLNCTSWSPFFQRFTQKASLIDSRHGFGIQPSWPTTLLLSPGRIPIDHVLHSQGLVVVDRRLGPHIGSDHLPVIVDFFVPRQSQIASDSVKICYPCSIIFHPFF
jgi:endonuclease/exonuclease/phosphatase (EEP) superfamily protein YafD